jgi:hypothetical protein
LQASEDASYCERRRRGQAARQWPARLHAYAQKLEGSYWLGEALYLKISDGQRVDASLKSCMGALAKEYLSS